MSVAHLSAFPESRVRIPASCKYCKEASAVVSAAAASAAVAAPAAEAAAPPAATTSAAVAAPAAETAAPAPAVAPAPAPAAETAIIQKVNNILFSYLRILISCSLPRWLISYPLPR